MQTNDLVTLAKNMERHGPLKLSTISTYAANDGKFFASLASGSSCTIDRAHKIFRWFDKNWPEDLDWPSDIPRPEKNQEDAA